MNAIRHLLAQPRLWLLIAPLALVVTLPTWRGGLTADDFIQATKLTGAGVGHRSELEVTPRLADACLGLFQWLGPGLTAPALAWGALPWWTSPEARQTFWRPLAAATHWLDYQLWPDTPLWMHAHSALWFCALLLMATAVYRSFPGKPWVAGLAVVLFAINQEHYQSIVWIAARNSLIAALFMALTVGLYHGHVQRRSPALLLAAAVTLALGLLAGEGAIAAMAYIASYTLMLDRRRWAARLSSLAPLLLVVVSWRVVYRALGFGIAHTELYADPGAHPLRFAANVLEWAPVLVLNVMTSPILGHYASLAPSVQPLAWIAAVLALLALAVGLYPLLRADPVNRFWALGLVLAAVPACATTVLDDRVVIYAAFGFAPLVAAFVGGVVDRDAWVPRPRVVRLAAWAVCAGLIVLHVLQPLPGHVKRGLRLLHVPPPAPVIPDALRAQPGQTLVVVNPPDVLWLSYYPFRLLMEGHHLPEGLRVLSSALGDVDVTRTGIHSVEVSAIVGPLIPARLRADDLPPGAPARDTRYRMRRFATDFTDDAAAPVPARAVALPGLTVNVTRVDARRLPTAARFTFAHALDDARYRWVVWDARQEAFIPFTPPPVGRGVQLSGPLARPRR